MPEVIDAISAGSVAAELRAALDRSQLTQKAFAAALGTSQPRLSTYLNGTVSPSATFYVSAQRVGAALEGLARLNLLSAPTLGTALHRALSTGDDRWSFRLLMQARDQLRFVLNQHRHLTDGWIASPLSVGRVEWDRLTAAVVGHEFVCAGLGMPPWTRQDPLPTAWIFPSALLTPDEVEAATPPWLAESKIFIPGRDLVTA